MQGVDNLAWKQHWISYRFEGLEKMLHPLQGQYSYGDTVTMADCCLVPQVTSLCKACGMTLCALARVLLTAHVCCHPLRLAGAQLICRL